MKTNKWYSFVTGGCIKEKVGIKFIVNPHVINQVEVSISIPCRTGQYIIVDNNDEVTLHYYKGKCIVKFNCSTYNIRTLDKLLLDISIWFRFTRAIRLDAGIFTAEELLRIF